MTGEHSEAELPTECRFDQLRFIEILNIQESQNELEFIKELLENAIDLEKLIISICKKPTDEDNENSLKTFFETLQSFRSASSRSTIIMLQMLDSDTRLIAQAKEQIKQTKHVGSKVINGYWRERVVLDTLIKEVVWVVIDPSLLNTTFINPSSSLQEDCIEKDDDKSLHW
ncbi:hypothetical protein FRX31_020425 [Thalictrum thalictroides]|uniref:Uncharacterized protein n=1 Tax=Thalictrum thalictroides TaxID=46969 RepID=A0A7J6VY00_THATH|nr:hypothetical protein FRX31_020425 [Thalictrum thalictroides]